MTKCYTLNLHGDLHRKPGSEHVSTLGQNYISEGMLEMQQQQQTIPQQLQNLLLVQQSGGVDNALNLSQTNPLLFPRKISTSPGPSRTPPPPRSISPKHEAFEGEDVQGPFEKEVQGQFEAEEDERSQEDQNASNLMRIQVNKAITNQMSEKTFILSLSYFFRQQLFLHGNLCEIQMYKK